MLPKGWKACQLKDVIASLEAGVSVNGEGRPADLDEKGVLKVSSVSYGIFKPQENKVIIEDDVSRAKLNPKKDKIIFSRANTPELVGASAYIHQDYPNLYLSDKLWQIEPRSDNISMRWLSFLLGSPTMRKRIADSASGSSKSMQNISKVDFLEIEISLPPLPEQKKIAEILGSWDTAIEQLETLIEKKQLLKRGLMQKLLSGKVRFPEFEGEEWKNYNLGDVVKLNYGKSQKDVQIDNGVYPIYGTGGILGYANEYLYEGDSILIGRKGTIDKPIRIKGKFWIVDTAYYASDFKSIDVDFLLFRLQFLDLKSLNEASGVPSLNRDTFYNTKIQLPSLHQQKKIVKPLCLLDLEINYLSRQLEALKTQKLGLMQQLLTGKRRVQVV